MESVTRFRGTPAALGLLQSLRRRAHSSRRALPHVPSTVLERDASSPSKPENVDTSGTP